MISIVGECGSSSRIGSLVFEREEISSYTLTLVLTVVSTALATIVSEPTLLRNMGFCVLRLQE